MLDRISGLPVMMRSTPSISDSLGRRTTNCSQSPGVRNESSLLPTWTIRALLRSSKPTVPASSCSAEVRTRTERCSRCSTGFGPHLHTRPRTFNRCRRSQAHPSPRPAYQQVTGNARQRGESVVSTTRRTAAASTRRRNLTISAPEGRSASAQFRFSSMQRIRFDNRALRYSATFRAT